jgi:hypothetical protein
MGVLYVIVIGLLVMSVARLLHARRTAVVATGPLEVSVRGWRTSSSMAWRAVREIELARSPVIGVDDFCVTLKGDADRSLSISTTFDGFNAFEAKMLELWPSIRAEWLRIRALSPNLSQRLIVWRRS